MKKLILILAACACACSWAGVTSARLGALGRNDNVVTNVDIDGPIGAFASTGAVKRAELHGTPTRWTDATGCVWQVVGGGGGWSVYTNSILVADWSAYSYQTDVGPGGYFYELRIGPINEAVENFYSVASGVFPTSSPVWADEYEKTFDSDSEFYGLTNGDAIRVERGGTNLVGRVALTNDIPAAPDLSPIQQDIADLRTESSLVYRLYSGSNVVAEVTNYNSQVHAPELRLMQLNESNEYVTVWSETNGLTRTLARANEYTDAALTNAAPRAWSRTTSGLGAEAPSNTTWISTPTTVIAGGLEYAKVVDTYGEVWVLSSNGMAAEFNPDTNAYFRISADDGTPVFSIEKTDAQVVGANAAGITVGETSVTVPVPVVSQTSPTCFWRYSLAEGDWDDGTNAPQTWDFNWTGGTGAWVLTLDFNGTRPPSLFLRFSFLQEGGVVIRNNATTDISAGIWVNGVKFVPTVSGNNLIWTKQ